MTLVPKRARALPRKKPTQERSVAMVEALLEAAARVFVAEGYAHATTNRIAAAAGVSVGSLYQYFPSKDAIAVELLRRYREGVIAVVGARLDGVTRETFPTVVRVLLHDLLRAEGIHPTLHRVLVEQVLRTSARREVLGFEERLEALIGRTIREISPDSSQDPALAAFIVVRVVLSVIQSVVVERPKDASAVIEALTQLVSGYVGVPH